MLQIRFFICNLGFLVGGNLDLGGGGIGAALGSRKKKRWRFCCFGCVVKFRFWVMMLVVGAA